MDETRVRPREITELLQEVRGLLELGDAATYEQWLAYHERKADVLQRIAANPGELVDATEAAEVAENAARQVGEMRRHPCQVGGDPSCR
jgi:hypothetical protein